MAQSHSQEPEDEVPTTSRRVTRGRATRASAVNRSIAETDLETDTGADDTAADEHSSSSAASDAEAAADAAHAVTQKSSYSFSSMASFMRSPYRTRSASKPRTTTQSYTRSSVHVTSSPTKALSFQEGEEGEEDSAEEDDVTSPPARRNFRTAATPQTPGQIEAHDDAHVYMLDCCDSHEVKRPDGTVAYRRHSHGGRNESPIVPEVKAARSSGSGSGLVWYVLLSLLMVGMLGPWALKQITHRPPSFVGQSGQGGIITQADLDKIINHVVTTLRSDLKSHQFVTEPRLDSATATLAQKLAAERAQHVKTAVADAVRQVYGKLDQSLTDENTEDAATLAAARREILDIIDARIKQATAEWSTTVINRFTQELAGEAGERQQGLKALLVEVNALRAADAKDASAARTALRSDVLSEIQLLLAAEQQEDLAVSAAFDQKLAALFSEENAEDAATLQAHLLSTRTEFQSLFASRLDTRLEEFERTARGKFMAQAADTFAPLSAVLNKGDSASTAQLNEDLVLQRLKAHLNTLVDAIPQPKQPKEVDETALENRLADRLKQDDKTKELDALQEQLRALQAELKAQAGRLETNEETAASATNAASAASAAAAAATAAAAAAASKVVPVAAPVATPAAEPVPVQVQVPAKDYTQDLEALNKQIADLRAELARSQEENGVRDADLARAQKENDARDAEAEVKRAADAAAAAAAAAAATAAAVEAAKAAAVKAAASAAASSASSSTVDVSVIRNEITAALELYSADRTAKVDYALRSSGGRILAHSAAHQVQLEGNWLTSIVKKCFMSVRKPEEILNDNMSVGSCWPMAGHNGYIAIGLRQRIVPTSISLQHIARDIAPDATTTPKEFTIWGLDETEFARVRQHTNGEPVGTQLGRFTYDLESTQLQSFTLQHPGESRPYSIITVGFTSNYGNPSYTCIYRVRVHGY